MSKGLFVQTDTLKDESGDILNFLGHTSVNCFVAGVSGAVFHHLGLLTVPESIIYSAAFVFSTFLLGPDLDLYYSKINKNWGVLRFIWWPYARLSKHRGLSHTPFLSSVIRLAYALLALSFVFGGLFVWTYWGITGDKQGAFESLEAKHLWPHIYGFIIRYKMEIIAGVTGVILSDIFHFSMDHLSSVKKKLFG